MKDEQTNRNIRMTVLALVLIAGGILALFVYMVGKDGGMF